MCLWRWTVSLISYKVRIAAARFSCCKQSVRFIPENGSDNLSTIILYTSLWADENQQSSIFWAFFWLLNHNIEYKFHPSIVTMLSKTFELTLSNLTPSSAFDQYLGTWLFILPILCSFQLMTVVLDRFVHLRKFVLQNCNLKTTGLKAWEVSFPVWNQNKDYYPFKIKLDSSCI